MFKEPNANISYSQKIFNIDSSDRTSGSCNTFYHVTDFPRDHEYKRCSILEAEIPKSYYHLDSNASFTLVEATGSQSTTVTIAGGVIYTGASLVTTLKAALDAASLSGSNNFTYTVALNTSTGKFTITASSGDFHFTFNTTTSGNKLLSKYLGFDQGDSAESASSILISPNVIDLQRYDVLFIRSSIVNNAGNDIFGRIYVGNTIDLGLIKYTSVDPIRSSVGLNDNLFNSHFSLTDKNGALIELNGVNWRFNYCVF
jgi:hypothetical protein